MWTTKRGSKNSLHSTRPWNLGTGMLCESRLSALSTGRDNSDARLDDRCVRQVCAGIMLGARQVLSVTYRPAAAGRKRVEMEWVYAAPGTCVSPRGLKRCSAAALYGRVRWVRCYTPDGEPGFMMGTQLAIRGLT